MIIKEINKKIKKVPPNLIPEIIDYIDFLINKHGKSHKKKKPFQFSWQGGLAELSKKYTSVELQHKAKDFR